MEGTILRTQGERRARPLAKALDVTHANVGAHPIYHPVVRFSSLTVNTKLSIVRDSAWNYDDAQRKLKTDANYYFSYAA